MNHDARSPATLFERLTRLFGLFFLAPLLLVLTLPVAIHISQNPDWGLAVRHLTIVNVRPGGPADAAGIQPGDQLLSVDGQPLQTMVDYFATTAGRYDRVPRDYGLRRGAEKLTLRVTLRETSHARMIWGYSLWIAGLAFLLIGWWVLSKRNDPVARNFFVLCMIFAFFLADIPDGASRTYMTLKETVRDFLQLLWPAFFLRFLMHFPSRRKLGAKEKQIHRLLLLPVVPLFLLSLYAQFARLNAGTSQILRVLESATFFYFVIYFIAGLLIFARKVLRRDRPIQHTKMRVVLFGLICGLTPFLIGTFLASFFPGTPLPNWQWLGFFLVLVPFSFALAIMRYGALDTAFVVRSSLIYGALSLLLLMGYLVIVGVMGHYLTSYFRISAYPLAMFTIAGSALLVAPARRSVQVWIDHAFYPARRANRLAIEELAEDLAGVIESHQTAETLVNRLGELYRPERLSLFLADPRQQDRMQEAACLVSDQPARPVFSLPRSSELNVFLDQIRRPVFAEELEEMHVGNGQEADAESVIERLGCELLVPLVTGNRLSGFLAFGPKGSGDLYSQEDLANLRTLAIQAAALLESRRLYQESLARKRLETELAVAQQIQTQLLPTASLELPELQICGRMDSCREVGGDYFDYFSLDSHRVAFAIADVAGKGIPAALLMTSLRVAFRSEISRDRGPRAVVGELNHAVKNITSAGQFISFFCGVLSIPDQVLLYCNAGMNPPILFRPGRPYHEYLKKGGPVLGINAEHKYRSGTVNLLPGDLLLMYTDGITEEVNAEGEFFDLERLIGTISTGNNLPLEDLRERIFATVTTFGGINRSDDRTIMLCKIK